MQQMYKHYLNLQNIFNKYLNFFHNRLIFNAINLQRL